MKTITLPNGTTLTWDGSLSEKLRVLDAMGIPYTPTAEELQEEADIQTIKDTYITTVARMEQIKNAATPPFTQAGFNLMAQAVRDEAEAIERVYKFLKRLLT